MCVYLCVFWLFDFAFCLYYDVVFFGLLVVLVRCFGLV